MKINSSTAESVPPIRAEGPTFGVSTTDCRRRRCCRRKAYRALHNFCFINQRRNFLLFFFFFFCRNFHVVSLRCRSVCQLHQVISKVFVHPSHDTISLFTIRHILCLPIVNISFDYNFSRDSVQSGSCSSIFIFGIQRIYSSLKSYCSSGISV